MLVEHLDVFAIFKDVCIRHIPHKYGKEMAKKSESVSIPSRCCTNTFSLRKVQKKTEILNTSFVSKIKLVMKALP